MEVYTNRYCSARYVYARPYTTSITCSERPRASVKDNDDDDDEERRLRTGGHVDVYLVGVPDGVSPRVYQAYVAVGTTRRLYLYAENPVPDKWLPIADTSYGERPYPLLTLRTPCAHRLRSPPAHNFYTEAAAAANRWRHQDAAFVEYRYADQRHTAANLYYDPYSDTAYRLALPADSALLVLIMPSNFVRASDDLRRGYFHFDDNDLIVHVLSKHPLSAQRVSDTAAPLVNDVSTDNGRVMDTVLSFYSRMGVHNVYTTGNDRIVGYDSHLTLVVGDVSDL